ncbi:hypothetical protein J3R83DRAFT_5918 [Lanmaoa asiatica]|nr:hypothetical protein J3R83DRAFT_5918 [Lanmaoa asiatica]
MEMPDDLQVMNIDLSGAAYLDRRAQNDSHIRPTAVIKAELPVFTSEWVKCFVEIRVDNSPNSLRTKPTRRAGQHDGKNGSYCECLKTWLRDYFSRLNLVQHNAIGPARPETILRFDLKRKVLLRQQSLASAKIQISDLLVSRQHSGGMGNSARVLSADKDYFSRARSRSTYTTSTVSQRQRVNGDQWRLLIRLHETGNLPEVVDQLHAKSVESCMAEIVVKLEAFMAVGDAVAQVR